ncbi:hypothetical protein SAMN05216227_102038 [Pseudorhodobacter antarcticus]|uniref:Haemolysin XhlA n=1 Tax=Pseudorhodobacter antarcticus TaxID=1077947 RepID=A0A1H8IHD8_9RHOB|nr:hypothetical protein [Pseudorhodobacter antarcticus]SEN67692.1 hypothetical protein SAMN05216227_102038 [Pseudorhodobacter antarcticus]
MTDNPTDSSAYLLGQIDAKVSHLLTAHSVQKADMEKAHDGIHDRLNAHGERLTHIERTAWKTAGIISLIPIGLTLVGLLFAYLKL